MPPSRKHYYTVLLDRPERGAVLHPAGSDLFCKEMKTLKECMKIRQ